MSENLPAPSDSRILIYQSDFGETRLEVRLQDETVWLTQNMMAELFQKDVRTINEHIKNIYEEGELEPEATIRKFRIVQAEGKREVRRLVDFYNLDMIISVGYRVKSGAATRFRQWATARLREYIVKGFTLDDERHCGGRPPPACCRQVPALIPGNHRGLPLQRGCHYRRWFIDSKL